MVPRPSKAKRQKQSSAQIMPDSDTHSSTDIGSTVLNRGDLALDDNEELDKTYAVSDFNLDQVSLWNLMVTFTQKHWMV